MARQNLQKLSLDEQEELVLDKLLEPTVGKDGKLRFERSSEMLSLEESAVALWMIEGRKRSKPMTKMGLLKIEQQALLKIRLGLAKYGIKSLDDVLDTHKGRKALSTKFDSIDG